MEKQENENCKDLKRGRSLRMKVESREGGGGRDEQREWKEKPALSQ